MAVIVMHKPSEKKYILVGTGYGTLQSERQITPLFGSLPIGHNNSASEMAAVCDDKGNILFVHSEELVILKIDGVSPSEVLH